MNVPILGFLDSGPDILIVVLVVLLLFGSTQLPKLARSLGSAQREFKKGLEEGAAQSNEAKQSLESAKQTSNPPSGS